MTDMALTHQPILASDFGVGFGLSIGTPLVVLIFGFMAFVSAVLLAIPRCRLVSRHFSLFITLVYLTGGLIAWIWHEDLPDEFGETHYVIRSLMPLFLAVWCMAASIWMSRSLLQEHRRASRLLSLTLPGSGIALALLFMAILIGWAA